MVYLAYVDALVDGLLEHSWHANTIYFYVGVPRFSPSPSILELKRQNIHDGWVI